MFDKPLDHGPSDLQELIGRALFLADQVPRIRYSKEDKVAKKKEKQSVKKDHEVELLAEFLQSKFLGQAPAHFYDVGCGKGYLSFELAERY